LGARVAEGVNDARSLAASVVLEMPEGMRAVLVREFLGWMNGSDESVVQEYERAATISPGARLGELTAFQRAALIGALRLRRKIERG
jgi:hypothetical protein